MKETAGVSGSPGSKPPAYTDHIPVHRFGRLVGGNQPRHMLPTKASSAHYSNCFQVGWLAAPFPVRRDSWLTQPAAAGVAAAPVPIDAPDADAGHSNALIVSASQATSS